MKYILALDQGTTSSRCVVFDENMNAVASHSVPLKLFYPQPGWVETDGEELLRGQVESIRLAVRKAGIDVCDIAAAGITNQRETTLLWNRRTGKPVCSAVIWQCRRTASYIERLYSDGADKTIRDKTGLIPDAYFSGTKLEWMLDHIEGARDLAEKGELCFGTVDSFLIWHLSGGRRHVTDATNASRTMLFNIRTQEWDKELLQMMHIPKNVLPEVIDCSGYIADMDNSILGVSVPIAASAGDQHAALFGQGCFEKGMCKNTYGTGCFVLSNTGDTPMSSGHGLLTTVAWRIGGKCTYALEGSVFSAGAAIQWLRDSLGIVSTASETEALANSLTDNGDVYFVPAFTGLGAPYWDMYARGTLIGLTRGTTRAHIARAVLESIAYQSADVIHAMEKDTGIKISVLRADGGASANNFLMQFQSDILGIPVLRPKNIETTAMGAAMLAARAAGILDDAALMEISAVERRFDKKTDESSSEKLLKRWKQAVERCQGWAEK